MADLKHNSFSLAKNNTVYLVSNKEKIENINDLEIVDMVDYGEIEKGKSLTRKQSTSTQEYQDANNNKDDFEIKEPSPTNSRGETGPTYLADGEIAQDLVLSIKGSPYIIEKTVIVPLDKTLNIEAGVVINPRVQGSDSALIIEGKLLAQGTSEKPIKFTSLKKDPQPGDYGQAILFTDQSKGSVLDYVIFEYGDFIFFTEPMVAIFGTKVKISNSVFRKSLYSALSLINSDSEITNSLFEDNVGAAISIQAGQPKIENCLFSKNQKPILITLDSQLSFSNNQLENNFLNGIFISSKELNTTSTLTAFDFPYILEDTLIISENGVLILKPGTNIKTSGDFPFFEIKENGQVIQEIQEN